MIPSWQEETNDAFIAGEEAENEEAAMRGEGGSCQAFDTESSEWVTRTD